MVRELKESLLPWLSGQVLPQRPTLADYDALARCWIEETVLPRRHRTTGRLVGEAWAEERPLLRAIPRRILAGLGSPVVVPLPSSVGDNRLRKLGEQVEVRDLVEYEEVAR